MTVKFDNGEMFMNGKRVLTVFFEDYSNIESGNFQHDSLDIENNGVKANVTSSGNTRVYQNKNVVSGPIVCGGDFHIGDK